MCRIAERCLSLKNVVTDFYFPNDMPGIGKLSDWHQLWFKSADSSGNGHRLNTIRPSIPQGAFRGVLGGHKFKSGKAVKWMDRLAPNSVHVCGLIWEWR